MHHQQGQKEGEYQLYLSLTTPDTFAPRARTKQKVPWCLSLLLTTAQSRRLRMCKLRVGGRKSRSRFVSWGRLISILMGLLISGFRCCLLCVLIGGVVLFSMYDMLSFLLHVHFTYSIHLPYSPRYLIPIPNGSSTRGNI